MSKLDDIESKYNVPLDVKQEYYKTEMLSDISELISRCRELEKAIEEHHYQITLRTQGFDNDWVNKELYAVLEQTTNTYQQV